MIKKTFFGIIIFGLISLGISFAYTPFKSDWTCNFNKQEDPDGFWKEQCENEMVFAKFTEVTGTREMSTTCCGYLEHSPEINIRQEKIDEAGGAEKLIQENKFDEIIQQANEEIGKLSKSMSQLHDLLLKLSSQIYYQSKDKQKTLNTLSNIFGTCFKKQKNIKVKAVCGEFYYDLIGTNPVISKITFDDVLKSLRANKFIKRGVQYSDLVENYTPINYHYASIRSMYMAGDYALGLMDGDNYFDKDPDNGATWKRIMVLKAGDTHRQDFAEINGNINFMDESYLYYNKNNLYLVISKELRDNVYKKEGVLKGEYRLNNDKTRDFVDCYLEKDDGKGGISKIKDNRCSSEIGATITTVL